MSKVASQEITSSIQGEIEINVINIQEETASNNASTRNFDYKDATNATIRLTNTDEVTIKYN